MTDTVYASGRKYGNMTVIFRKQQIEGEQNTFFKVTKKKTSKSNVYVAISSLESNVF